MKLQILVISRSIGHFYLLKTYLCISHHLILQKKWLQAKITRETVIPVVVMASHSNTQKAGIMMHFRKIVITANLTANS